MMFRLPASFARLLPAAPLLLALLSPGAQAQPPNPSLAALAGAEVAATAPALVIDDGAQALLLAFGQRAGLARLAERLVDRLVAEDRLGQFFQGAQPAALKQRLADQFCQMLSGPCPDPASEAGTSALPRADVPALAGLLRESMDAQAVPPAAQDALLARLAPLQHRLVLR